MKSSCQQSKSRSSLRLENDWQRDFRCLYTTDVVTAGLGCLLELLSAERWRGLRSTMSAEPPRLSLGHRKGILMYAQQIHSLTGFAWESSGNACSVATLIFPFPEQSRLVCLSTQAFLLLHHFQGPACAMHNCFLYPSTSPVLFKVILLLYASLLHFFLLVSLVQRLYECLPALRAHLVTCGVGQWC